MTRRAFDHGEVVLRIWIHVRRYPGLSVFELDRALGFRDNYKKVQAALDQLERRGLVASEIVRPWPCTAGFKRIWRPSQPGGERQEPE